MVRLAVVVCAILVAIIVYILYRLFKRDTFDEGYTLGVGAVQLPTRSACPYGYVAGNDNDPLASKDHFTAQHAYTELADKTLDRDLLDFIGDDHRIFDETELDYHDDDCSMQIDPDCECDCTYSVYSEEDMESDMALINARLLPVDLYIEKDIGGAPVRYWVGDKEVTKEAFQYAQVVLARCAL